MEEIEIDLGRLFRILVRKAWCMALTGVLCAAVTLLGTFLFVTPRYRASAVFYVNNHTETGQGISSADISASRVLVDSCIVILNTRETLNEVIEYAEVERTWEDLQKMLTAEAVDSTEFFEVAVSDPNPEEAEKIANAIACILPRRIGEIMEGAAVKVVDSAMLPAEPDSPNYLQNTVLGLVIGLAVSGLIIGMREITDISIRTEEDLARCCNSPILASVPDMTDIGAGRSHAPAESYGLLYTKLQLSFPDEENCPIIGISSAMAGEGKSLTAVNLAYTMSQRGKRVLLIDCGMRCPSLPEKLPIRQEPGLSDYLMGQDCVNVLIQPCGLPEEACAFHVISSGRIPPCPVELLSSVRMEKMLARLREKYDCILLDLPPVSEAGETPVVSGRLDGMLMVVRRKVCDRNTLSSAMGQLASVRAKVLGVVFYAAPEQSVHSPKSGKM